jgi:hypothetical protein
MLTEVRRGSQEEEFREDMLQTELTIAGAHNDGITCIELISEN